MRRLSLREHQTEPGVALREHERDAVAGLIPSLRVSPTSGLGGHYDLTPGAHVGQLALPDLAIEIRPKIGISRFMFLLSYAADPRHWRDHESDAAEEAGVLEAVALGFSAQVRRAVSRGILQGYRTVEESLLSIRGRLRVEAQVRQHFGHGPPAEVRYDDFTEDTELNRLLRAALYRLGRMRLRSARVRRILRATERLFGNVRLASFDLRRLPEFTWNRLNERFRGAVELAKRILGGFSFERGHGGVRASAFLVDMNRVFEDFVVVALREALGLSSKVLVQSAKGRTLCLDAAQHVRLKPDISWWRGHRCVAVADVKYKRLLTGDIKHGDLYQLLAYTVATELIRGMLIYAKGEEEPRTHDVAPLGKRLEIDTLDLSVPPQALLQQIEDVAARLRATLPNAS